MAETVKPHKTVVQEKQLGTGDAVKPALPFLMNFEGKVLVLLGDEPFLDENVLEEMIEWDGLSVMAVRPLSPKGLGRMIVNEDGMLERIVEDKDCTPEERTVICVMRGISVSRPNNCRAGWRNWIIRISKKNITSQTYHKLPKRRFFDLCG